MRKLLSTWSAPIAVLLAVLCPLILPVRTLAAVDTLEDIGPDGTEVASRVIDGVTVTISVTTGSMEARTYYDDTPIAFGGAGGWNIPLHPENVSGNRFIRSYLSFEDIKPIQFHFSAGVGPPSPQGRLRRASVVAGAGVRAAGWVAPVPNPGSLGLRKRIYCADKK